MPASFVLWPPTASSRPAGSCRQSRQLNSGCSGNRATAGPGATAVCCYVGHRPWWGNSRSPREAAENKTKRFGAAGRRGCFSGVYPASKRLRSSPLGCLPGAPPAHEHCLNCLGPQHSQVASTENAFVWPQIRPVLKNSARPYPLPIGPVTPARSAFLYILAAHELGLHRSRLIWHRHRDSKIRICLHRPPHLK